MMKGKQVNEHVLSFRVNSEERQALLAQAQKYGVSLSQLLRKKVALPEQAQRARS